MTEHPTIVIPGLQGTELLNYFHQKPSPVWSLMEAFQRPIFGLDFDNLALSPDGSDLSDDVVVQPHRVLDVPYGDLMESLRRSFGPAVYAFRYDWRRSIEVNAKKLTAYVQDLQRKPMKTVQGWQTGDQKFNFVCHSLGGLVFRAFLDMGGDELVNKVVFMGTPHRGSLESVEGMIRGETSMFGGRKEMRRLVRTFPSVYELLPTWADAVVEPNGNYVDIFKEDNWQSNIVNTQAHPKKFGLEQKYLDDAKDVLKDLPWPQKVLDPSQCLVLLGSDRGSTMKQVCIRQSDSGDENHWFDFENVELDTGDGTVLLTSAVLEGSDYIWFRSDDAPTFSMANFLSLHVALPMIDEAGTITARFFRGRTGEDLLPKSMNPARLTKTG